MNRFPKSKVPLLTAVLVAVTAASAGAQCAMCGTAVQGDDPLARGILWSVVFLISLPYAIVGTFAIVLLRAARREKRRRAEAPLHLVGGLSLVTGRKESMK